MTPGAGVGRCRRASSLRASGGWMARRKPGQSAAAGASTKAPLVGLRCRGLPHRGLRPTLTTRKREGAWGTTSPCSSAFMPGLCAGHPRFRTVVAARRGVAGTGPAMTPGDGSPQRLPLPGVSRPERRRRRGKGNPRPQAGALRRQPEGEVGVRTSVVFPRSLRSLIAGDAGMPDPSWHVSGVRRRQHPRHSRLHGNGEDVRTALRCCTPQPWGGACDRAAHARGSG